MTCSNNEVSVAFIFEKSTSFLLHTLELRFILKKDFSDG